MCWCVYCHFTSLSLTTPAQEKHGITLTEAALRWLQHHSQLTPDDRVIIGASKLAQLEQSMGARYDKVVAQSSSQHAYTDPSEKGPLPDGIVKLLEDAHSITRRGRDGTAVR